MGPLKGIKVIELAQIMAGPTCGMLLADMGADVIKVEKLPGGDDTRSYSEPAVKGESAAFMILNRNKRGIAVNLKTAGGLEVVKRLLAGADVVTENYRKGTLEKLGLGYDVLQALNPRLIYCAISGYGRTGPYADKGGFDLIAQGVNLAGIAHILELEHRITQLESDNARLMSGHTPPTRTAAGRTNTNTNGEQL